MKRVVNCALVALVATGCTQSTSRPQALVPREGAPSQLTSASTAYDRNIEDFFQHVAFGEGLDERVRFKDLVAAAEASSVVLVGRVKAVRTSRTLGESAFDAVTYTSVVVEPARILRGSLPSEYASAVEVEFLADSGAALEMQTTLPSSLGLWFLHRKGEGFSASGKTGKAPMNESAFYRLSSSQGLFFQGEGGVINPVVPVETPELGADGRLGATAPRDNAVRQGEGYSRLDDLIAFVAQASR